MSKFDGLCVSTGCPCSPWVVPLILTVLVLACVASDPSFLPIQSESNPRFAGEALPDREAAAGNLLEVEAFAILSEEEVEHDLGVLCGAKSGVGDRCPAPAGAEAFILPGAPFRYAPKQDPPRNARAPRKLPEASKRV